MSVRQHDSPLRYFVNSHSREEVEHLVELDAYDGNGSCTCEHFMFRIGPLLKEGAEISSATRCHHILEARDHFTDNVMGLIKERQGANVKAAGKSQASVDEHNGTPRRKK